MKLARTCSALALAALSGSPAWASAPPVSDAAFKYLPPSPAELARVKDEFRDAAARTVSDRSGQIFLLPAKYNYIVEGAYAQPMTVHLQGKTLEARGTTHGNSWEYDTHIPLVLWGPGCVKAGASSEHRATQQDLVPTYAELMGTLPPQDARGRVLQEAFLPKPNHPKVILTMVFDQGGEVYYRAHPGATPFIDSLKREGTSFTSAYVSHLDAETGIGHTAIGTGAWPSQTGISSNNFWLEGLGRRRYAFNAETEGSPLFQMSPSLGDIWLNRTKNQALLGAYCYADRAAIGMGGHGSLYKGNKKPDVVFYDERAGKLTTNPAYYTLPAFLEGRSPASYLSELTGGTNVWMGHPLNPRTEVRATPAYVRFDGDNVLAMIQQEPWGQDDVTDLLFVTLKSTDAAGHTFGHESDEAGAVLAEQDKQFQRIVEALVAKVGKENLLVALTADHGSTPLPELSGGTRLLEDDLISGLNSQLDKLDNGVPLVNYVSATQLWVDLAEMKRNHLTLEGIKQAALRYTANGKPFFVDGFTRDEAIARSRKFD